MQTPQKQHRFRECHPASDPQALPGYEEAQPMVFCGLFPIDADRYGDLREALGRLQLNDAALQYEPEVCCCYALSQP